MVSYSSVMYTTVWYQDNRIDAFNLITKYVSDFFTPDIACFWNNKTKQNKNQNKQNLSHYCIIL